MEEKTNNGEKTDKEELSRHIIIKDDLVLEKDTTFESSIEVRKNIKTKDGMSFNLTVNGSVKSGNIFIGNLKARDIFAHDIEADNIHAHNLEANNIEAGNIFSHNIKANNIHAWDIHAHDVDANNIGAINIFADTINAKDIEASALIVCEKRLKKAEDSKTIAGVFVDNKSKITPTEQQIHS